MSLRKDDPVYYKIKVNAILKQAAENGLVVEGEIKFKTTSPDGGECAIAKLREEHHD